MRTPSTPLTTGLSPDAPSETADPSIPSTKERDEQTQHAPLPSVELMGGIITSLPSLIMTIDREHRITWISHYRPGYTAENVLGAPALTFVMPAYREVAQRSFEEAFRTGKPIVYEVHGPPTRENPASAYYSVHLGPILRDGEVIALTLVTEEITARKRLEEQLRESVERLKGYAEELEEKNRLLAAENAERERTAEALRRQQEMVSALSTPIIQAWQGVLALPIVGSLDGARAAQMMEKLLAEIVRTRARFAVLDLTGVEAVDTSTVGHLLAVVRAAGLLGSRCLVSGISPSIAQTMVSIGSDAEAFTTFGQLQDALRFALLHEGVGSRATDRR